MAPSPCPDHTVQSVRRGQPLARFTMPDQHTDGAAIAAARLARGQAWFYGYDLAQLITTLRHRTSQLDARPSRDMGRLLGPRHPYSFFELSNRLPRTAPVADLHQDILRLLIEQALIDDGLPRLWHLADGALRCVSSKETAAVSTARKCLWTLPNAGVPS